jgi:hypothetical protein
VDAHEPKANDLHSRGKVDVSVVSDDEVRFAAKNSQRATPPRHVLEISATEREHRFLATGCQVVCNGLAVSK